jgi:hypothetical protein
MYYGGLEIGVMNWFVGIPQTSRKPLVMSDISFGLERIVWVANKSSSYFDAIGPLDLSIKNEVRLMDNYRTAVLMALGGVEPGYKDRASKIRSVIKDFSSYNTEVNRDLVAYYVDWWQNFSQFPVPAEGVEQIIIKERNRNVNLDMKNALGIPDSISVTLPPIDYVKSTIEMGIPFERVRSYLENLK